MIDTEKRKFIRYDALHLLDYIVMDKDGNKGVYSMGRTLDVSVDGIKMEIQNRFDIGTLLLITVGLEDNLIDLLGEVTHTSARDGRFLSGIVFRRITERGRAILLEYVKAFQRRKKEIEEATRPD